jgi:AcrR family transcriptional regulator
VHDAAGLRDRKRADARRAIARAALRLASQQGPDAVTVADIAAAADVSPRTVFNHFATKDDAILGHDAARTRELRDAVEAQPADLSPVDAIRAVMLEALGQADDLGATWRTRAELVHRYPRLVPAQLAAFAEFESGMATAIANRLGVDAATDPFPSIAAAVCLTAMRTAVDRAVASGDRDLLGAVEAAFDLVRDGLGRP